MLKCLLLLSCAAMCINVHGQIVYKYEMEFLDSRVYKPCENYPNNFVDQLFDMDNVQIEQTDDGSIMVKGSSILKIDVDPSLPITIEGFKKERGTWQQTLLTQKRADLCTACFDANEMWHDYLKNTPKEQLTCPFRKGQTVDFDVNEPTIILSPLRSIEGEYNFHVEVGNKTGDLFICAEIFAKLHQV